MPTCTKCGRVDDLHRKSEELPFDPVLNLAVDNLFHQLQHLKHTKSYDDMLAVVKAAHAIEELTFVPILFKRYKGVQVINSRYAKMMITAEEAKAMETVEVTPG